MVFRASLGVAAILALALSQGLIAHAPCILPNGNHALTCVPGFPRFKSQGPWRVVLEIRHALNVGVVLILYALLTRWVALVVISIAWLACALASLLTMETLTSGSSPDVGTGA